MSLDLTIKFGRVEVWPKQKDEQPAKPLNRIINVIFGGVVVGGESSSKRKAYLRLTFNVN